MDVVRRVAPELERPASELPEVCIIRPKVFPDARGFFAESYNAKEWAEKLDFHEVFLQDNHSFSLPGVLRGLHSQPGMGKLVTCLSGTIFDVALDARANSPTFGKWHGVYLDGETKAHFWVPPGFLHGFLVTSDTPAHVTYKCTAVYDPNTEWGVDPFDEELKVEWPIADRSKLNVSDRDRAHGSLKAALERRKEL